ncbi:MAG: HPF/RaiA family ribosome-associated protein [Dichotomicrobium sp.]
MEVPVEIAFRHLESSEAVENRIHEHIEKLKQVFDRLVSCRVTVELVSGHRKGNKFLVTVEANVPGKPYFVGHSSTDENHQHDDIYLAIRDAFAAVRRQLQDYARKVRDDKRNNDAGEIG